MALALGMHLCMIGIADLGGKRCRQSKQLIWMKIGKTAMVAVKALGISAIPFTLQTVVAQGPLASVEPILDTCALYVIGAGCLVLTTIYLIMVTSCLAFLFSTHKFPIARSSKRRWLRQSLVALTGSSMAIYMATCIMDLI